METYIFEPVCCVILRMRILFYAHACVDSTCIACTDQCSIMIIVGYIIAKEVAFLLSGPLSKSRIVDM